MPQPHVRAHCHFSEWFLPRHRNEVKPDVEREIHGRLGMECTSYKAARGGNFSVASSFRYITVARGHPGGGCPKEGPASLDMGSLTCAELQEVLIIEGEFTKWSLMRTHLFHPHLLLFLRIFHNLVQPLLCAAVPATAPELAVRLLACDLTSSFLHVPMHGSGLSRRTARMQTAWCRDESTLSLRASCSGNRASTLRHSCSHSLHRCTDRMRKIRPAGPPKRGTSQTSQSMMKVRDRLDIAVVVVARLSSAGSR
jgi:hypothetical protein